jgi:hypothetical protein
MSSKQRMDETTFGPKSKYFNLEQHENLTISTEIPCQIFTDDIDFTTRYYYHGRRRIGFQMGH